MRNYAKIRSILWVVPAIWLSLIGNDSANHCRQDKDKSTDSDWVTSMPVSMNGKLPAARFFAKGKELRCWHNSFRMNEALISILKPERFFDDPLVVDLCKAISDANVAEMKRLIAKGADFKKIGKDGMTPLYWAFLLDHDPRPFELLIKGGADPNVIVNYSLDPSGDAPSTLYRITGLSVTHLVSRGCYNRQFRNVFEHGGDPNLEDECQFTMGPAFWGLDPNAPDAVERLQLLIDKGAKLDHRNSEFNFAFVLMKVGIFANGNRLALAALKAGANYQFFYKPVNYTPDKPAPFEGCYFRLIHRLAEVEPIVNERPESDQTHYRVLVTWLEEHGESLADAKADLKRWEKWNRTGQSELIEKEHQKLLAKEKAKNMQQ